MNTKFRVENIWLIDDDEVSNYIAGSVLKDMQIAENVLVFENPELALADIKTKLNEDNTKSENLILLDINMPGMDGFEFLEAYHDYFKDRKSAIIAMFLTTSLSQNEIEKAQNYKNIVSEYIEKPVLPETVNGLIEKYFKI